MVQPALPVLMALTVQLAPLVLLAPKENKDYRAWRVPLVPMARLVPQGLWALKGFRAKQELPAPPDLQVEYCNLSSFRQVVALMQQVGCRHT